MTKEELDKRKQASQKETSGVYAREASKFTVNEKGEFTGGSIQSFLRVHRYQERILRRAKNEARKAVQAAQPVDKPGEEPVTATPKVEMSSQVTLQSPELAQAPQSASTGDSTTEVSDFPEGSSGDILYYDATGTPVVLVNPGAGKFSLVHEGGFPYWKSMGPC